MPVLNPLRLRRSLVAFLYDFMLATGTDEYLPDFDEEMLNEMLPNNCVDKFIRDAGPLLVQERVERGPNE